MLMSLSRKIAAYLLEDLSDQNRMETCAYGIDLALYTFLSTLALILIGCVFEKPIDTMILIAVYYLNQTVGGGYHASTHWKCFVSMAVSLLVCLVVIRFFWQVPYLALLLTIIALAILWKYPLHLHPHKAYLKDKAESMKKKSKACALFSFIAVVFLSLVGRQFALSAALGVFSAAVSRMIGVGFRTGEKC